MRKMTPNADTKVDGISHTVGDRNPTVLQPQLKESGTEEGKYVQHIMEPAAAAVVVENKKVFFVVHFRPKTYLYTELV